MTDKLRIALVGVGGRGRAFVNAFAANPKAEVVAVCDENAEVRTAVATQFGAASYDNFTRMFDKEQPDAAAICLPHYLYPDAVGAALAAGAHVLKEKPFARDLADAQTMCDAAANAGKILMIGGQSKFSPAFQRAKAIIDSGELGDVFLVTGRITYRWTNALEDRWSWRGDKALSGGVAIIDSGWHPLDLMHWFKGMPERLHAATGSMKGAPNSNYDVDDKAVLDLEYPDGAIGSLVACFITVPAETRITVHGTRGSIDSQRNKLLHYEGADVKEELDAGSVEPTQAMVDHFVECALAGSEPVCSGAAESLEVQRIIEAAYRSAQTREAVDV